MIKKFILPMLAISTLFLTCSKESTITDIEINQNIEQAKYPFDLKILFLYEEYKPNSQVKTGWFVTREGEIRTYQTNGISLVALPSGDGSTLREMNLLQSLGNEMVSTVDEELLYDNYQLFRGNSKNLSVETANEDQSLVKAYYGIIYLHSDNGESPGTCNEPEYNQESTDNFENILLEKSGVIAQENLSPDHQTVLNWLKSLAEDAGL